MTTFTAVREKFVRILIFWGLGLGLIFLIAGHQREKSVIPLLVGLSFGCFWVAERFSERPPLGKFARTAGVVLAGLTGYSCFKFPLPFA